MKIVVLDGYTVNPGDLSWEALELLGELIVYDRTPLDEAEIIKRIGDSEVILTNKTPITKGILDACPNLKYISVLATGYNVVDYEYAKEKNIPVSNVPAYGTMAVAQFAIALLLEICHHVADHSVSVFKGDWEHSKDFCYWNTPLIELCGKTMGIIGFGSIGKQTARIAHAMGMKIIAYTRTPKPEDRDWVEFVDLDTLLSQSDVISLHCPLFPATQGIICKENIEKMKDGVIILNNSRGGLVVEKDLADALHSGKVAAAGVDVVSTEPIKGDNPLLSAPNCYITPHISWAALECRDRIMQQSVANIKGYLNQTLVNVINP